MFCKMKIGSNFYTSTCMVSLLIVASVVKMAGRGTWNAAVRGAEAEDCIGTDNDKKS